MTMDEKKRYVKVELWIRGQSQGFLVSTWENAIGNIGDGEGVGDGEMYIVTGVEMTQEEFDALGEWEGW